MKLENDTSIRGISSFKKSVACHGDKLFERYTLHYQTSLEIKFVSPNLAFINADTILCACQHNVANFCPRITWQLFPLATANHFLFTQAETWTRYDMGKMLHYLVHRKYVFSMHGSKLSIRTTIPHARAQKRQRECGDVANIWICSLDFCTSKPSAFFHFLLIVASVP